MTIELSAEEKISIVEQHIKNIAYSKYNVQVSLIEANSATVKNTESIASLNNQVSDYDKQITALQAEIDSLTPPSK
jgi:prefoldin subunit 5